MARAAGGGGVDDRLHSDGGGGNLGGRDGADFGGAELAAAYAADLSGDPGDPGDREYARREGYGRGVYYADVPVCGDAAGADRGGGVEDGVWRAGIRCRWLPMPPALPATVGTLGTWMLMKAFASGCAAMTGVEAVSNGVMAFGEPRAKKAQRTLTVIIGILMVLLFGIAYLAKPYQDDADGSGWQRAIRAC